MKSLKIVFVNRQQLDKLLSTGKGKFPSRLQEMRLTLRQSLKKWKRRHILVAMDEALVFQLKNINFHPHLFS
ncbi:MAG: hypothetical protein AAB316_05555 [Bacteroidota bacterium]